MRRHSSDGRMERTHRERRVKVFTVLMAGLGSACASTATPPPSAGPPCATATPLVALPPIELPPLPSDSLEALRSQAPEVAMDVERIHALALEYAAQHHGEQALDLAATAQRLLAATSSWAKTEHADPSNEDSDVEPTEGADLPKSVRKKNRAKPQETPALPMIGAPPVPADETAEVRRRLSRIANDVAKIRSSLPQDQRVALEGVQSTLIEADRAVSEGLIRRAEELAEQAERLLQSIRGEGSARAPEPVSDKEDQSGFLADVRKHLGERAMIRGGAVAVRLDNLVHYQDKSWSTPESSPLDGVRPLVRGYREIVLNLVTIGPPTQEAFSSQKDALREHLSARFQISTGRVSWMKSTSLRLEPGTYLILDHGAAET